MIWSDIINGKTVKNELFLLKINIRNLIMLWRIPRIPYAASIILIYVSYIFTPTLLLSFFTEYTAQFVSFIGYTNILVSLTQFCVLLIRRLVDAKMVWPLGIVLSASIYTLYINYINYIPPILELFYTGDSITTRMMIDINVLTLSLLGVALLPSSNMNDSDKFMNGIERVGEKYIRIKFGGFEDFFRTFSLYKVLPIIKSIVSVELFDWRGRVRRGELLYYYISYQIIVIIFSVLVNTLSYILMDIYLYKVFLDVGVYIFYIWLFVYFLKVIVERLHDSYSSGFWALGLLIPFINVYVIYLLLVKGSWQYVESPHD